jgi:hypothetical protein
MLAQGRQGRANRFDGEHTHPTSLKNQLDEFSGIGLVLDDESPETGQLRRALSLYVSTGADAFSFRR